MYAPIEEGFVKTYIPLKEVCPYGEPIARSQARRVVYRLEVFRVFQNKHPQIELIPLHANESVLGMIKHVRRNLQEKPGLS